MRLEEGHRVGAEVATERPKRLTSLQRAAEVVPLLQVGGD